MGQLLDDLFSLFDDNCLMMSDMDLVDRSDHLEDKMVTTVSLGSDFSKSSCNLSDQTSDSVSLFLLVQFSQSLNKLFNFLVIVITSFSCLNNNSLLDLSQFSNVLDLLDKLDDSDWVMEDDGWFDEDWGSNLSDSSSDVNNLLVNSLDSLSQDNDLSSDDWSSWFRSNDQSIM